jgi:uncharacterized membrane protein (UPF0182 family)
MRNWKLWAILAGVGIFCVAVVYVLFNFIFLDFFVNLWWFASKELQGYFLLRIVYRYLVFLCILFFFFLIFFSNFWFASRYLGHGVGPGACPPDDPDCGKRRRKMREMFQSGSMKVYTPLSALMAIPIAAQFYERWEEGLLFFFGPWGNLKDPAFGKDVGFYLFDLPIFLLIQNRLLIVFILLLAGLCLLYYAESRMLQRDELNLPRGARIHLSVIGSVLILIILWGFFLDRYELLYTESHLPRFSGPGFIQMRLHLPLIWLSIFSFLLTAIFGMIFLHRRKGYRPLLACAFVFALVLGVRNTSFLFNAVDKYYVQPNEVARESRFIGMNIDATLDAFNLAGAETRDFRMTPTPQYDTDSDIQRNLRNVPVWDRELLDAVYTQLQGIRTYYSFPGVDVDRYIVSNQYQQVYLAAREISMKLLPEGAQNWINRRLQYTHGYGAVMTPASQGGDEPITWFMRDLPVVSELDYEISRPQIYFGEEEYDYVIAPNDIGEIDHPMEGREEIYYDYTGRGGVSISSPLRKILFALYFGDRNIFFTTKTNKNSRILFRQNIREIVETITPFIRLDNDPYLVVGKEGFFWIQDAYTTSDKYPYARKYGVPPYMGQWKNEPAFNYIRNSVKIVIDAYHGTPTYYISDPNDPIIRAYSRIYPGLLKPIGEMPEEIRKHVRYPKQLFATQMAIYSRYHQKDPEVFYREEDTWEFAKREDVDNGDTPVAPFYMTLNLLDPATPEFMLLSPMSPVNRDNLRALTVVGCDGDNYGKITIFSFSRGRQIHGPSQVTALINQDTGIAEEFTLWNQAGSEVRLGRLIVFPVSGTILYIQPVYLGATQRLQIPELKRVIVSAEDMVAMDRTLLGALENLSEKRSFRMDQIQRRLQIPSRGIPTPPESAQPQTE